MKNGRAMTRIVAVAALLSFLWSAMVVIAFTTYTLTGNNSYYEFQQPRLIPQNHMNRLPPIRPTSTYDPAKGFYAVHELVTNKTLIELHRECYSLKEEFVFFITPTYQRPTQMADMTRLAQTLAHDKGIYWIVVEDAKLPCNRIRNLLERTGLPFAHIAVPTPPGIKISRRNRGVNQRNKALGVIELLETPGVIYFGDDDNAYDIRLFPQIRQTKRVGVSGVGLSAGVYERCHVNPKTGKVDRFYSNWAMSRKFKVDMAGFSFHTSIFLEKKPLFRNYLMSGMLETDFVEQMIPGVAELEPLDKCEAIYAWHVKTKTADGIQWKQVENDADFVRLRPSI